MMETDEFVVNNLDDQIAAFQETAATVRKLAKAMGPEERNEVEEASAVLRKGRAAWREHGMSDPKRTHTCGTPTGRSTALGGPRGSHSGTVVPY